MIFGPSLAPPVGVEGQAACWEIDELYEKALLVNFNI